MRDKTESVTARYSDIPPSELCNAFGILYCTCSVVDEDRVKGRAVAADVCGIVGV